MLFMPVRHCCPFACAKRSAMLRIGTLPSGAYGLPPGIAKRPTTGVRCPGANTCATEYGAALPLGQRTKKLSNELTRGERLQIMLTPEELDAVDTWRFQRRMPSRAAAVRELLKRGLAAEGFLSAEQGTRSKDFSIVGAAEDQDDETSEDSSKSA